MKTCTTGVDPVHVLVARVDVFAQLGERGAFGWDWVDHTQPYADDLYLDDEDRSRQTFTVFAVMPRKERCISWTCPISHDQEAEVRAWLRGPRVLGVLRTLWRRSSTERRQRGERRRTLRRREPPPVQRAGPRRHPPRGLDWPLEVAMQVHEEAADVG
jgi:hypothetical protein